jgi:hypothetical protein
MHDNTVDNWIEYGKSIAKEFRAKRDRIRHFVTEHNLTSGTANEMILRDYLSDLSPKRYKVGQGFICDPTKAGQVSNQCDILVYDQTDYPLIHSEGEIKVVWPESVHMVIEVKTKLNEQRLHKAIKNIRKAKELRQIILGIIFAFGSNQAENIIASLSNYPESFPMQYAPEVIVLLDKKTVFVSTKRTGENSTYMVRQAEDEAPILTYLLLRILDELSNHTGIPQGGLRDAASRVIVNETKVVGEDIAIGIGSSALRHPTTG